MNRFTTNSFLKRILDSINISAILFITVIILFLFGISKVSNSGLTSDKDALEKAIQRDIVHCYSVEGEYPPSIDYLEKKYGLTYDKDRYIVDYDVAGTNIMPSVFIIEKD